MVFFQKRKQKKLLAELKSRRRAEDDLLSPALRSRFDGIIDGLSAASGESIAGAVRRAESEYASLPLPRRGKLFAFLDLVFVVGAIAFGLRGLFFQPFRIPTGSMQPTLYGIHYQVREGNSNFLFDRVSGKLHHLIFGSSDAGITVKEDGAIHSFSESSGIFFDRTHFAVGRKYYSLPGNIRQVADYANPAGRTEFAAGDTLGGGYMTLGDHLFVERFSLYLKPPARGDVMVFNTENLSVGNTPLSAASGYYYIKRVAALPGDTVKISGNQLWIKTPGAAEFVPVQKIAKRFEKIYSNQGGYHGHLSNMGMENFACGEEYTIPENSYLMLGDNSRFSMDSRYFGVVPRRNLIGRAWLVFYPFSRRVGLVDSKAALHEATGEAGISSFPVMSKQ